MEKLSRKPEDCVIVAADFKSTIRKEAKDKLMRFARKIKNTGVTVKINFILRALGYDTIDRLHDLGLRVFADLKLTDISGTLGNDAALLLEAKPELLTVMLNSPIKGLLAISKALAGSPTELLGVTVLTDYDDPEAMLVYRRNVKGEVKILARRAKDAGFGGLILSAKENALARKIVGSDMTFNNPAIRPAFSIVAGDDQNRNRVVTPMKALGPLGATRIIIGRPIVEAKDPYRALQMVLEEAAMAL